jgi:hypothetical protein
MVTNRKKLEMNARAATAVTSTLFLLILLLSPELACGLGTPSAADGESAIRAAINNESAGRIKLVSFKKTDAVEGELMGFKIYGLEFQIEIEFLENCRWVDYGLGGTGPTLHTAKLTPKNSNNSLTQFNENLQNPGTDVTRGQHVNVAGTVRYVKKESGWVLDEVRLSQVVSAGDNSSPRSATEATPSAPSEATASTTRQEAIIASRAARSRAAFEKLTATLPDAGLFPKHVTEFALPYDKVWEAASQALAQQKETILRSEKENGVLMTDLTRHSLIGIPSYERYCLLIEKQNDSSTKMTFILQTYHKNILVKKESANAIKASSRDMVNIKMKEFLRKFEQNLRNSR